MCLYFIPFIEEYVLCNIKQQYYTSSARIHWQSRYSLQVVPCSYWTTAVTGTVALCLTDIWERIFLWTMVAKSSTVSTSNENFLKIIKFKKAYKRNIDRNITLLLQISNSGYRASW